MPRAEVSPRAGPACVLKPDAPNAVLGSRELHRNPGTSPAKSLCFTCPPPAVAAPVKRRTALDPAGRPCYSRLLCGSVSAAAAPELSQE